MEKAQTHISNYLSRVKGGNVIFPADFRGTGTEGSIKMALHRLSKEGSIKRLAHGIYYKPKIDSLLGELTPSAAEVCQMIAKKEKVHIMPAGAYALNKLGLSTQVPTNLVYITDGVPRQLKIGKVTVKFKATTNKKLSMKGKLSKLIIQALEELDLTKADTKRDKKIKELLLKEDAKKLKHDLALAPGRIYDYLIKLLKQIDNERMAETN